MTKLELKQEEYIAYLKRAIHSESIIDNVTAGVRDKYDAEITLLKKQDKNSRRSPIKICAGCGGFTHGNPGHDIII